MPWNTQYHSDTQIVEAVYSRSISPAEVEGAVRSTLALGVEHSATRFLTDCTELTGGHSITDLYGMMELLLSSGLPYTVREAGVLFPSSDPTAIENVGFWELACRNRGINVRVFPDRASAQAWLTEG